MGCSGNKSTPAWLYGFFSCAWYSAVSPFELFSTTSVASLFPLFPSVRNPMVTMPTSTMITLIATRTSTRLNPRRTLTTS
jgi:hypothetical protein